MEIGLYDWRNRKFGRMKVAVAIGGSALIGAGASMFGANEQSNAATNAMNSANQTQMNMYNNNVALEAPFRQSGTTALNTISQDQANGTGFAAAWDPSNIQNTPGYQFQLQQGNQAIQRSAAAQGGLLSGAAAKAMDQYSQGLAGTTYQNQFNDYLANSNQQYNQLMGVANIGQNATNATVGVGQNTANQVANNQVSGITGAAAATASGVMGAANSLNSGLSNYLGYQNQQNNQLSTQNLMQYYGSLNSAGYNNNIAGPNDGAD